jgi:hypothetical protein
MTDEAGAAAPATEQAAPSAPAAAEQATPKIETLPNPNVQSDPENAEPKAQETEPKPEGEEPESDEPKRLTRNQRLQRKAARLSTMVAEQAAELERLRQATDKTDAESEPKEADYNGDWTKYQADYAAWKAAKTVSQKFADREQRDAEQRLRERRQEAADEFLERSEQIKAGIPDFDDVIGAFDKSGGKFAPHVVEELMESEKGPLLAYTLAKDPNLAAQLNALSPRDAAREIGRLEAKVSLPQPKKQTQAPAPLATVKGGVAPTKSLADLAKSDDASAYAAARRAQRKARA